MNINLNLKKMAKKESAKSQPAKAKASKKESAAKAVELLKEVGILSASEYEIFKMRVHRQVKK